MDARGWATAPFLRECGMVRRADAAGGRRIGANGPVPGVRRLVAGIVRRRVWAYRRAFARPHGPLHRPHGDHADSSTPTNPSAVPVQIKSLISGAPISPHFPISPSARIPALYRPCVLPDFARPFAAVECGMDRTLGVLYGSRWTISNHILQEIAGARNCAISFNLQEIAPSGRECLYC